MSSSKFGNVERAILHYDAPLEDPIDLERSRAEVLVIHD